MRTRPIVPATLSFNDEGIATSPVYGDVYHPRAGAFAQARSVFLAGNELPARWQGRDRFVILETGFGLGNNFLATWQAWAGDPARPERLVFISVEQSPFTAEDLRRAHADSPAPELAQRLVQAWPALTHNLHVLDFEGGRVQLLLALGDIDTWLPELVAEVDAFYLDGFAPMCNPKMWEPRVFKALARLAAPAATLATWTSVGSVRRDLRSAGFEVRKTEGSHGKRHITVARHAPHFQARHAPSRLAIGHTARHAVIVGAGLAGCATAWALARQGWTSTLIDRHPAPARETSGNPAGLFHGIVNPQDGTHARFNRAAALMAQREIGAALQVHRIAGQAEGLLRLDNAEVQVLRDRLSMLGLPAEYVQAVDAPHAAQLSGLPLRQAAWFYPGGGWVDPAALCRAWLLDAGPRVAFRGGLQVSRLQRIADAWHLFDEAGHVVETAQTVVLANAGDARRLAAGAADWPMSPVRGQLSWVQAGALPGLDGPRRSVAGGGYVVRLLDGRLLFGATTQHHDAHTQLRDEDQETNIAQLSRLVSRPLGLPLSQVDGRVGWRWVSADRLPLLGAVPDTHSDSVRSDQVRFRARLPGLHVFTALGSRGITWAALGARALASLISGAPAPLEASLLDAIDPARFAVRDARRG